MAGGVARTKETRIVALAGNPNVGKSTIFNALTGMNQHTGNWPGKTVERARGRYIYRGEAYELIDLPGTYSLLASSQEEEIASDFIRNGGADAVIVVCDATCLERNLILALQTAEITPRVVVCLNLIDEAEKKGISIDADMLEARLGVPVVATAARSRGGLGALCERVRAVASGEAVPSPVRIEYPPEHPCADCRGACKRCAGITSEDVRDIAAASAVRTAEAICNGVVTRRADRGRDRDRRLDKLLTSRLSGIPVMLLLLGVIFWLTIVGSNYPSRLLADGLFWVQERLSGLFWLLGAPDWLHGALVLGVYRVLAWVVSVMLPPMAVFFPLFTLLEDFGYLPRVAFVLDNRFRRAGACGKQALTMCMGFGCNAVGVTGCRIIDSPRERLIAILTNSFVPCNGRFPTLIAIITMFFAGAAAGMARTALSALILTLAVLAGIALTLIVSRILSATALRGKPSSFALELPPYRAPQIGRVIVRSIFDRTLFVLGRAARVAAPAGLIIWLMANVTLGGATLLTHCSAFLDPFAGLIGLDGVILLAFVLGFPANEIVIPIIIMTYTASGSITELGSLSELWALLSANGWTWTTAVCVMLFCLFHWPCATTCQTVKKETGSVRWTLLSAALPTTAGVIVCFVFTMLVRLCGWS